MRENRKGFVAYFTQISLVRFLGKLLLDFAILLISLLIAFLLRFEGTIPARFISLFPFYFSIEFLLLLLWELVFGVYKGLWRFTAFKDFFYVTFVISLEKLSFTALSFFLYSPYPRSIILISWAFALIGMVGVRAIRRYLYESKYKVKGTGEGKHLLLVGAGNAGRRLAQEISQNPQLGYKIVGFLDDDPSKRGGYLLGYPVLSDTNRAKEIVEQYDVEEVTIAMPSSPQKVREVFNALLDTPVKISHLPSLKEISVGKPLYQSIRDIDLADLLPRPPVKVNMEEIARFLLRKVVLVTGAGGSIGSELCRQLASFPLKKLVLLGHGENPLFYMEQKLKELLPSFPFEVVVGDIRNEEKINAIFEKYSPQIVFHTAAHKHVPLMELNPDEAITNNVYGTKVLAEAARKVGVEKFIYISTDKAVNPVNVMGAAKRVGELLMRFLNGDSSTAFISVRFGNVLGSKGSVLEVWERCIEENKPIQITHPDMERFFMTIPEAVSLILKAAELGKGGDLFVLNMGERVKIMELARMYTHLRGPILEKDIDVVITGARPGEKLREELIGEGEVVQETSHPSIMRIVTNDEIEPDFSQKLEELIKAALTRDPSQIKSALKQIVKNYKDAEE